MKRILRLETALVRAVEELERMLKKDKLLVPHRIGIRQERPNESPKKIYLDEENLELTPEA
jgi:hypothetical protein